MARIFGVADLLAGLLFTASFYQMQAPKGLVLAIGIFLLIKGLVFIKNVFSWIDMAIGLVLIFSLVELLPPLALIIIAAFLGLKALFSLFAFG